MNKLKLNVRSIVVIGIILILTVVAFGVVKANGTSLWELLFTTAGERLGDNLSDKVETLPVPEEEILGAVVSPTEMGNLICANDDCIYYLQQEFDSSTTTLKGNLTVVSIPDPFLMSSSTDNKVSGVVIKSEGSGATYRGWYGATSTVELVRVTIADKTSLAPTTTWEMDCSASANGYSTSTYAIIDTEGLIPTSTIGTIESGMSSSTAYGVGGIGSMITATSDIVGGDVIRKIQLTPAYPYLVCNIWQPYGTALDTFTGSWNTSNTLRYVNVRISRQQL